ncbi:MAG: hypothetical protein ABSH28_03380 [Acidobacteriota bacterium]
MRKSCRESLGSPAQESRDQAEIGIWFLDVDEMAALGNVLIFLLAAEAAHQSRNITHIWSGEFTLGLDPVHGLAGLAIRRARFAARLNG